MKRSGMSLLEILIVLSILAVLIAIIAPRILGSQKKADIKAAKVQIANIEHALNLYAVDVRTFPQTEDGLLALLEKPADEKKSKNWDGPYLDGDDTPADPWGNAFHYEYPPTHGKRDVPDVWSVGPDGEENTEDDITNWGETDAGDSASSSAQDRSASSDSSNTRSSN